MDRTVSDAARIALREELDYLSELTGEELANLPEHTDVSALGNAAALLSAADRALHTLVDDARAAGASWAQIGEVLGISRQAAQQRFRTTPKRFAAATAHQEPAPELVEIGREVLEAVGRGDVEAVESHLAPGLTRKLGEIGIGPQLQDIERVYGPLRSREPFAARVVGHIVSVSSLEHRELGDAVAEAVVTFSGAVTSLRYSNPETPKP